MAELNRSPRVSSLTCRAPCGILPPMCGRFKHCDLIDAVPNCPVSDGATPQDCVAHHFVFDPITDERNFRPAKIKQPNRAFRDDQKCKSCGLSMYPTEERARAMVHYLTKGHKKALPLELGTHIARAMLRAADGESTPTDTHGHYTFFEYVNVNACAKFRILGAL